MRIVNKFGNFLARSSAKKQIGRKRINGHLKIKGKKEEDKELESFEWNLNCIDFLFYRILVCVFKETTQNGIGVFEGIFVKKLYDLRVLSQN